MKRGKKKNNTILNCVGDRHLSESMLHTDKLVAKICRCEMNGRYVYHSFSETQYPCRHQIVKILSFHIFPMFKDTYPTHIVSLNVKQYWFLVIRETANISIPEKGKKKKKGLHVFTERMLPFFFPPF